MWVAAMARLFATRACQYGKARMHASQTVESMGLVSGSRSSTCIVRLRKGGTLDGTTEHSLSDPKRLYAKLVRTHSKSSNQCNQTKQCANSPRPKSGGSRCPGCPETCCATKLQPCQTLLVSSISDKSAYCSWCTWTSPCKSQSSDACVSVLQSYASASVPTGSRQKVHHCTVNTSFNADIVPYNPSKTQPCNIHHQVGTACLQSQPHMGLCGTVLPAQPDAQLAAASATTTLRIKRHAADMHAKFPRHKPHPLATPCQTHTYELRNTPNVVPLHKQMQRCSLHTVQCGTRDVSLLEPRCGGSLSAAGLCQLTCIATQPQNATKEPHTYWPHTSGHKPLPAAPAAAATIAAAVSAAASVAAVAAAAQS